MPVLFVGHHNPKDLAFVPHPVHAEFQQTARLHFLGLKRGCLFNCVYEEVHIDVVHEVGRSETGKLWFWHRNTLIMTACRGYQLRRFCPSAHLFLDVRAGTAPRAFAGRISVGKPDKYVTHATL